MLDNRFPRVEGDAVRTARLTAIGERRPETPQTARPQHVEQPTVKPVSVRPQPVPAEAKRVAVARPTEVKPAANPLPVAGPTPPSPTIRPMPRVTPQQPTARSAVSAPRPELPSPASGGRHFDTPEMIPAVDYSRIVWRDGPVTR